MSAKRVIAALLAAALCVSLLSCAAPKKAVPSYGTQVFVDSAGRSVTLPAKIEKIAPSGAYAQIFLYTLCPEKLLGLSGAFSRKQKEYIAEKYQSLPVFGQFYGKSTTMNLEEIIKAAPDVIIDVGEAKTDIASDMDGIQQQTGIPVIFVEATLNSTASAYEALGRVLGVEERAAQLSGYARSVIELAAENAAAIPDNERIGVLYGSGEYGLGVAGAGSVHAEVIDAVGAVNVAQLSKVSGSGGDEVSIEQVLLWDPDAVILAPESNYGDIFDDATWADVGAVKRGAVYEIPSGPYSWLDRPPSVQRVLGVLWLGNLLYPELYDYDMIEKTQEFYLLFWQYDLSNQEAAELLSNSTFK